MMERTNVIALFCEDIRQEKGGSFTLIGILPDNISVASPDGPPIPDTAPGPSNMDRTLARLCVYIRINFDPNETFESGFVRLVLPSGDKVDLGPISPSTIAEAKRKAVESGNPLAGVISRAALGGFQFPAGIVKIELQLGGEFYMAGALNIRHLKDDNKESATSSTAS